MDSNTNNEFDKKIESFIRDWEEAAEWSNHRSLRLAMTHHIVKDLYQALKTDTGNGLSHSIIREPFGRFKSVWSIVKHSIYYVFWILKWLIVYPLIRYDKIILSSFMPDRLLSREYIKVLRRWGRSEKASVVHFSIIYDIMSIFSHDVFCYPHMLYALAPAHEKSAYQSFAMECQTLAARYFNSFSLPDEARHLWNSYSTIEASFDRLINLSPGGKNIVCLAQDIDNTGESIIFTLCCRKIGVPTICFNHAVPLYTHLLRTVYSDIAIVWGEQQKKRIQEISSHQPRKIFVSGNPVIGSYRTIRSAPLRHYWVYMMQAYKRPLQETASRSIEYTVSMLNAINEYMHNNTEGKTLLVKPHPSDVFSSFPNGLELYTGKMDAILPAVEILFSEDTTLSMELLRTDIPLVYIADSVGNVHTDFELWGAGRHIQRLQDVGEVISAAIAAPVSEEPRKKMYEFYFGSTVSFPRFVEIASEYLTTK